MAENVIERLKIKIEADTSGAQKQLEKLKKNLEYFRSPFQSSKDKSANEIVPDKSIRNADSMNSSLKKLQDSMKKYGVAIEKVKLQYSELKNISGSIKSGFSFGSELDSNIKKAAESSLEVKDNFSDIIVECKTLGEIINDSFKKMDSQSGGFFGQSAPPLLSHTAANIKELEEELPKVEDRFSNIVVEGKTLDGIIDDVIKKMDKPKEKVFFERPAEPIRQSITDAKELEAILAKVDDKFSDIVVEGKTLDGIIDDVIAKVRGQNRRRAENNRGDIHDSDIYRILKGVETPGGADYGRDLAASNEAVERIVKAAEYMGVNFKTADGEFKIIIEDAEKLARIISYIGVNDATKKISSLKDEFNKAYSSAADNGEKITFGAKFLNSIKEFRTALRIALSDKVLTEEFDSLSNGMKKVSLRAMGAVNVFKAMGNQLKKLKISLLGSNSLFDKFTGMLSRILRYRILTGILNQITEGFKEGITNLYQYSKIAGTDFAVSMDNAATSLQYFRNSLGAVAAPVINALIPYFDALTDKIVDGVNWLNQFIAKLTGASSWTKAIRQQKEYAEAADETAKANKRSAASFDQLNVIGSGNLLGTSLNTPDYSGMFEEVSINEISESASWLAEHFEDILEIAKDIGIAILAWKISSSLFTEIQKLNGDIKGLKVAAGITLMITGFTMAFDAFREIGSGNADLSKYVKAAVSEALGIVGALLTFGTGPLGWTIGIAAALSIGVVGFLIGKNDKLERDYYNSEIGKYWSERMNLAQIDLETSVNLQLELSQIDSNIAETEKNFAVLKELVNQAFSINDIPVEERTSYETETLKGLVQSINDMGIVTIEFDGTYITQTKDEVTKLIEETEKYYMTVAYQDAIVEAYRIQAEAMIELESAQKNLEETEDGYRDVQKKLANELTDFEKYILNVNHSTSITADAFDNLAGQGILLFDNSLVPLVQELKDAETAFTDDRTAIDNLNGVIEDSENKIKTYSEKLDDLNNITAKPTIEVQVDTSQLTALNDNLKEAYRNKTDKLLGIEPIPGFASGGYPSVGQLFIAREAGPEMVGTIGGRNAVANNGQIVAGIQYGVAAAMNSVLRGSSDNRDTEQQNSLLREQNKLLRKIAEKELVLSPSVSLGRVVKKSQKLAETVTGG